MIRTLILILGAALTGCSPVVTDTACTAFQPIFYSPTTDSSDTVTQVRQHNAVWVSLCERKRVN